MQQVQKHSLAASMESSGSNAGVGAISDDPQATNSDPQKELRPRSPQQPYQVSIPHLPEASRSCQSVYQGHRQSQDPQQHTQ